MLVFTGNGCAKMQQMLPTIKSLRDQFAAQFKVKLPQLSMGMSDDFAVAIEEGATLVRIGTAIFGKRTPARLRNVDRID